MPPRLPQSEAVCMVAEDTARLRSAPFTGDGATLSSTRYARGARRASVVPSRHPVCDLNPRDAAGDWRECSEVAMR